MCPGPFATVPGERQGKRLQPAREPVASPRPRRDPSVSRRLHLGLRAFLRSPIPTPSQTQILVAISPGVRAASQPSQDPAFSARFQGLLP